MGRRDFQNSVAEILPRLISEQAKTGIGSIKFFKKDKKTVGKLYLRGGAIYAIELSTYKPNIVNRIATNEYISDAARDEVLDKFQSDPQNFEVVKYVLTRQIFPEKPLLGYIKDYFLDAFDELYTWDQVNAEWRTNDEPTIPTVPNVSPEDLIDKAVRRREYLETQISSVWNSTPKDMDSLGFRKNYDYDNQDYSTSLIISIANGEWTLGRAADWLGMSHFNLKKLVFELWQEGVVDIMHPAGLLITNRSPQDIKTSSSKGGVKAPAKQAKNEDLESLPGEVATLVPAVETPNKPILQAELPTTPKEESVSNPTPQFQVPQAAPFQPAAPAVAPAAPVTAPAPTFGGGGGSRISQLAQQLREELGNLDRAIQTETAHKDTLNTYLISLQSERTALLEQVGALDARIQSAVKDVQDKDSEIQRLQTERNESASLLPN